MDLSHLQQVEDPSWFASLLLLDCTIYAGHSHRGLFLYNTIAPDLIFDHPIFIFYFVSVLFIIVWLSLVILWLGRAIHMNEAGSCEVSVQGLG
jgi:hypothetical protein